MSGPLAPSDAAAVPEAARPEPPVVEVADAREAEVGPFRVHRLLPRRARRTVGAWCFADHLGPVSVPPDQDLVGPHPHTGLQTVTWLLAGELLHRDSLGSEQVIRPGQLNLMTAGRGVAHAEEATGRLSGELHGIQLWVAQPDTTRQGPPDFEHHAELPVVDLEDGAATVLVGTFGDVGSDARRDTAHCGVDIELRGRPVAVALEPSFEHALLVLSGAVRLDGAVVEQDRMAYLGRGRAECGLDPAGGRARVLLIGGVPFDEPIVMWWNFVARTRAEIGDSYRRWTAGDEFFGTVGSRLERVPVRPPPWVEGAGGEPV